MNKKKPKVLVAIPTMGSVHTMLLVTLSAWIVEAQSGLYDLSLYPTINMQPVERARNHIVDEFLKTDCTHLLFVDSDTIPPLDALKRLLAHDKPIMSAITPIIEIDGRKNPWRKWNCIDENDLHVNPNTGVKKVKGAGASCILIKREVFENMEQPYYEFRYQDDNGKEKTISEDIYFVIKNLAKGVETFADTSIICQHYKPFLF